MAIIKWLERDGVTSHPLPTPLWENMQKEIMVAFWLHCASGDNAAFGVLGYYAFVNRKSERTGMAFVFPWVGTISKIYDCGSRRTWNRTYFLYAVQVTIPELYGGFSD